MSDDDVRDLIHWKQLAAQFHETLWQFTQDWSEDDTAIRNLCRPVLGDLAVDCGDHFVPPLVEVVRMTIEKLRDGKRDRPPRANRD